MGKKKPQFHGLVQDLKENLEEIKEEAFHQLCLREDCQSTDELIKLFEKMFSNLEKLNN